MPARERMRLTDAVIARLRTREREYTVWDSRVPGLGVRVRPTGGRSNALLHGTGGSRRRVSLSTVSTMNIAEARRECLARQTAHEPERETVPTRAAPLLREFVEGEWKPAHFERYKPSTKQGVRSLLASRILPAFGSKRLDRIADAELGRWFDDLSRTAPCGANHALNLLRQNMQFAVACGHLDRNPARDVRPNPRPALTRFLSREEIGRLHRAFDRQTRKGGREQADIVRLLLLTGCRRSDILRLRWSEVRHDAFVLADSKTGARKVPLNSQARSILQRRPRSPDLSLWYRVRREAGIEDVRLHDLRHTFASHAVMNGVPVPVVSRLLGHSSTLMTLRHAHLGDREIEEAAERVGQSIAAVMGIPTGATAA